MAWTTIPNFGDEKVRINERTHESGAKIIEVLYGSKDAYGNSIEPKPHDGQHGHWIALEIDGVYQMLSHRYPTSEGGRQEYGKGRKENALQDLENDLRKRDALCQQATSLSFQVSSAENSKEMAKIQNEWKSIYRWHVPKEKELEQNFRAALDRYYTARDTARQQNENQKHALIQRASALCASTDYKLAGERMKQLMDEWKNIPSAGKEKDDILWQQFREERQRFYDCRKRSYEERKKIQQQNIEAKRKIISDAWNIARGGDYSKEAALRMKNLMSEWKSVGSVGKIIGDQLWSEFRNANDQFWTAKREDGERKHQEWERRQYEWKQKMQEAIDRKQMQVNRLYTQNENLRQRSYMTRNPSKRDEIGRWILENESRIRELELAISEMKNKMWK